MTVRITAPTLPKQPHGFGHDRREAGKDEPRECVAPEAVRVDK